MGWLVHQDFVPTLRPNPGEHGSGFTVDTLVKLYQDKFWSLSRWILIPKQSSDCQSFFKPCFANTSPRLRLAMGCRTTLVILWSTYGQPKSVLRDPKCWREHRPGKSRCYTMFGFFHVKCLMGLMYLWLPQYLESLFYVNNATNILYISSSTFHFGHHPWGSKLAWANMFSGQFGKLLRLQKGWLAMGNQKLLCVQVDGLMAYLACSFEPITKPLDMSI